MHLPSTSNAFILSSFDHRMLSGIGDCGCMKFKGIGDATSSIASSTLISGGISAATALASTALASWLSNKKQNAMLKTYTTSVVNELEPLLNQNKNAYLSGSGSCASQAVALDAFDSAWQWLQSMQACGNPQLGTPGQNCINDRAPGGKWDWTAMYRTPIASDPRTTSCASMLGADSALQSASTNLFNKIGGSNVQTNALDFASTQTGAGNAVAGTSNGALDASSFGALLSPTSYTTVMGTQVPTIALIGIAAVAVFMIASGR